MKIITLIENTDNGNGFVAEHGLSVYIETEKHRLLVDAGQTDAFLKNARKLNIDLSEVDTLIVSHGHYDHTGGIIPFSKINSDAGILMQTAACIPHYNMEKYIGIDPEIVNLPTLEILDGDKRIDGELFVFSGVTGRRLFPFGNKRLKMLSGEEKVCDDFSHEQYLVVSQNGKNILISGCAHNGILNILDKYKTIFGGCPDWVITGFHLMKREGEYTQDELSVIKQTASELNKMNTVFFTGHCTGTDAFNIMKEIMGDKLFPLHSGEEIPIKI